MSRFLGIIVHQNKIKILQIEIFIQSGFFFFFFLRRVPKKVLEFNRPKSFAKHPQEYTKQYYVA